MKNGNKLLGTILGLFVIFILSIPALAQESPQLPHLFYGTAIINGVGTPVNSVIIAKIAGEEKGRFTLTEAGKYGEYKKNYLLVQGDISEGAEIEFHINGIAANEKSNFDSGAITERSLTWGFPSTITIGGAAGSGTPVLNEPITCMPGVMITIASLPGLTISISCTDAEAGIITEASSLGAGFYAGAPVPGGVLSAGGPFEIDITGDFTVIATMAYTETGIDESTVLPYSFVGGVWTALPVISRDTSANTITFSVPSAATPYAAFAAPPAPATTQQQPEPTGTAPSFSLSAPDSVTIQAGSSGSLSMVVTSSKASAPNTIVTVSGPPASWVSISPASANIPLDGSQTFVITITVPAGESARTIPMTITARSGTAASSSTGADLVITAPGASAGEEGAPAGEEGAPAGGEGGGAPAGGGIVGGITGLISTNPTATAIVVAVIALIAGFAIAKFGLLAKISARA